jgi:hypothetical protein
VKCKFICQRPEASHVLTNLAAHIVRPSLDGTPAHVNSVHQAADDGLGCSVPAAGTLTIGQRVARSLPERWPAVSPAGTHSSLGSRPSTRAQGRGSLVAAPFNRDRNGRQENTGPCFARRVVDLLRRLSLDYGLRCFRLGLCRPRCSRRSRRRSTKAPALTWTKTF